MLRQNEIVRVQLMMGAVFAVPALVAIAMAGIVWGAIKLIEGPAATMKPPDPRKLIAEKFPEREPLMIELTNIDSGVPVYWIGRQGELQSDQGLVSATRIGDYTFHVTDLPAGSVRPGDVIWINGDDTVVRVRWKPWWKQRKGDRINEDTIYNFSAKVGES
jgi:hypothetical protein